jgi:hypothetical protein
MNLLRAGSAIFEAPPIVMAHHFLEHRHVIDQQCALLRESGLSGSFGLSRRFGVSGATKLDRKDRPATQIMNQGSIRTIA